MCQVGQVNLSSQCLSNIFSLECSLKKLVGGSTRQLSEKREREREFFLSV